MCDALPRLWCTMLCLAHRDPAVSLCWKGGALSMAGRESLWTLLVTFRGTPLEQAGGLSSQSSDSDMASTWLVTKWFFPRVLLACYPCPLPGPASPCDWQLALTYPSWSSSWRLPLAHVGCCSSGSLPSPPCLWLPHFSLFAELSQHPDGLQCDLHLKNSQTKMPLGNATVNMSPPWGICQSSPCSNAYVPGEHTSSHLSIVNSVHLTWAGMSAVAWKGGKRGKQVRWTVWEMPMKGAGRGFGTGMHTWRRTEKNQTKPNFALSWPCSPQSSHRLSQHFSDSSHLYLSLGAHSPMGVVHPTSSEDKCPLLKLAFSEWHSSF